MDAVEHTEKPQAQGGGILRPAEPEQLCVASALTPGQPTHRVLNQARPFSGHNAFLCDPALRDGVAGHGGAWGEARLTELGTAVGSEEWQTRASEA